MKPWWWLNRNWIKRELSKARDVKSPDARESQSHHVENLYIQSISLRLALASMFIAISSMGIAVCRDCEGLRDESLHVVPIVEADATGYPATRQLPIDRTRPAARLAPDRLLSHRTPRQCTRLRAA